MGNRWTVQAGKVDFVLELPPEVLAVVLSYLTFTDVLSCFLVCRSWKETILHLGPYWSGLLQGLGVSLRTASLFPLSHKHLYLAVKRHLRVAGSLDLVCSVPFCHPHYPRPAYGERKLLHFSSKHCVVVWRDGSCLRVEEVVSAGEVVYSVRLGSVTLADGLSVKWVHYSSDGCIYLADSSGFLRSYELESGRELSIFSWRTCALFCERDVMKEDVAHDPWEGEQQRCTREELTLKEVVAARLPEGEDVTEGEQPNKGELTSHCEGVMMTAKLPEREEEAARICEGKLVSQQLCKEELELREGTLMSQLPEQEVVMFAGCDECCTVLCCKLDSSHSVKLLDMRLCMVKLGEAPAEMATVRVTHQHTLACKAATRGTGLSGGTAQCDVSLCGSGKCGVETQTVCNRHYLLFQDMPSTNTIIIAMEFAGDPTDAHTSLPCRVKIWHKCFTCSYGVPVALNEIKSTTVYGELQLGHIHGKVLCVWETSEDDQLQLVSEAEIATHLLEDGYKLVLVALGKLLSIVQRTRKELSAPLDSEIYIVQTETGCVLNQITSAILPPLSSSWGRDARRWLSDVTDPYPPPLLLTVMYSADSTGRLAFALLRLAQNHQPSQAHWVQAVNHRFQK